MTPVALFIVSIAAIFLIGAVGEVIFRRTSIPDVIWLILVGIALGPVGGFVSRAQLHVIAPYFAAITLVIVLFEGGSQLRLRDLTQTAPRASLLSVLTFVTAMGILAVTSMGAKWVGWFPETWTWTHGFLLGSILGGSSSIIIMPAMMQAKVDPKVANLVGLESAFTDAFCVVGASALIELLTKGGEGGTSPGVVLLKSFGIALLIGAVAGVVWLLLMRLLRSSEHAYPVTLSALLFLYLIIDNSGGSAALGILTFAIIVGNAGFLGKWLGIEGEIDLSKDVRGFHSQMTFIIKSFFFTFIGAMLGPPISLIALGVLLGLVLFAARIPPTYLATVASSLSPSEKKLAVVSMPRGMAAGVLATMPMAAGVVATEGLPTLVFSAVFTTILIFAVGFPMVRRMEQPAKASTVAAVPAADIAALPPGPPPVPVLIATTPQPTAVPPASPYEALVTSSPAEAKPAVVDPVPAGPDKTGKPPDVA